MRIAVLVLLFLVCLTPYPTLAVSPETAARQAFGAAMAPGTGPAAPHGGYARGCIDGALPLPADDLRWQVMRPSRNRAWGHPDAIAFIERLADRVGPEAGWSGLLIGDISQPRGGPMLSGHRSHQIGLDIDIWLRPAPPERLSPAERNRISSHVVVARNRKDLNGYWTASHEAVLSAAAQDPAVARIFVNAAIKQAMCRAAPPSPDRGAWLGKIRPWWGHDAHFHVRLHCPQGAEACEPQAAVPAGDGCDETLAWWFSDEALNPAPSPAPATPRQALRVADLPGACAALVSDEPSARSAPVVSPRPAPRPGG